MNSIIFPGVLKKIMTEDGTDEIVYSVCFTSRRAGEEDVCVAVSVASAEGREITVGGLRRVGGEVDRRWGGRIELISRIEMTSGELK